MLCPGHGRETWVNQGHKDHSQSNVSLLPGADLEIHGAGVTFLRSNTFRKLPHDGNNQNSVTLGAHQIQQASAI